ncbi:formate dehydrogenase accessory sulfurtransferase FdhD [uncultured Rhodoblastus sp.]|uniref:formate dehydrogenase accessory sulfurtransferase FdhD n=1 Tax=uncultured Rhodoblastus sp. TaxID=543037 RepID=UPI0025DCF247|nr:formate dehydrogenase accessory sulfurtransferase FdhD [uncultured Rhodoblastus sp.]
MGAPLPAPPGRAEPRAAGTAFGGAANGPVEWVLPEEAPVSLVYNGRPFGVMLASPSDLEDFGLGFSLAERIIARPAEMESIEVTQGEQGFVLSMRILSERAALVAGRRRALDARSGCGLCGIESLDAFHAALPNVVAPDLAPEAILRAFADFRAHQPMRARDRSVHGAAWCGRDGVFKLVREDVGRHSALDKLIGAMARDGHDPRDGFALLSSRCGFELVQKAAAVGIGFLACVSAPTSLALDKARACGMGLACATRDGGLVRLTP